MNHRRALKLLASWNLLSASERESATLHIATCARCYARSRTYAEQSRIVRELLPCSDGSIRSALPVSQDGHSSIVATARSGRQRGGWRPRAAIFALGIATVIGGFASPMGAAVAGRVHDTFLPASTSGDPCHVPQRWILSEAAREVSGPSAFVRTGGMLFPSQVAKATKLPNLHWVVIIDPSSGIQTLDCRGHGRSIYMEAGYNVHNGSELFGMSWEPTP